MFVLFLKLLFSLISSGFVCLCFCVCAATPLVFLIVLCVCVKVCRSFTTFCAVKSMFGLCKRVGSLVYFGVVVYLRVQHYCFVCGYVLPTGEHTTLISGA